jgi:hypothetical protein
VPEHLPPFLRHRVRVLGILLVEELDVPGVLMIEKGVAHGSNLRALIAFRNRGKVNIR